MINQSILRATHLAIKKNLARPNTQNTIIQKADCAPETEFKRFVKNQPILTGMICPHTPTGSCLVNDKYPPSVRDQSRSDLKHGMFGIEPKLIPGHYPSINDDKKNMLL